MTGASVRLECQRSPIALWFYRSVGEDAWSVISATFAAIAAWRLRLPTPYRPGEDSELAVDDTDWPMFSTSTVIWSGLASATDHLDAIRRHLEARTLFSMAHLTLCRSALIGAAQAVWVLGPADRQLRLRRSRTVTAYLYKQHLQYLRGLQSLGEPHVGTDQVADVVSQRIPQLAAKRAADNQGEDLNTTDMIRQAARIAFPGDARLENEAVLAWRSSSGAAHGLPWPLFGSPGMRMTKLAGEDGIAEFQAGGSLDRMANTYMAAFHLADVGWGLLERRGSATA